MINPKKLKKIKKENNETLTIDEENFLSAFENYEKELF